MEEPIGVELGEIRETDLLIGIPSYNNARTIGHVVRAVTAGLAKYFPNVKAALVNSDGGSTDGTQEEVRRIRFDDFKTILISHPVHPIHRIVTPYHGIPGKGSAFRMIFETAGRLKAKACAVVDSDLRSITPEWVELLLRPIYEENFDYVAPFYRRHKFDGTITNSIIYPLTRTLYGKRIRQPIGGDFGFSGKLAKFYLTKEVWETDVARFGIDIWMTTLAIAEGYKVCQSYLGAKIHDAKDPGSDLGPMFTQVVSSVYGLMGEYPSLWQRVRETQPVPTFGFQYDVGLEPVSVNVDRMIHHFKLAVKDLMEIWRKILLPETALWLESIAGLSEDAFSFPRDLWVRIVYDFGIAYHKGQVHRDHLLRSMVPLYLGWVASFVKENQESDAEKVEEEIESLCTVFEAMKPYLIERWGWQKEENDMGEIWKAAITDSLNRFVGKLITFLPNLLAMVTILIVGFLIAWIVKVILSRFLRAVQFDKVSERWGIAHMLSTAGMTFSLAHLIARFFYWLIVLITLILGMNALELAATQSLVAHFFNYLPHLFAAFFILAIGYLVALFLSQAALIAAVNAQIDSARHLSRIVRWFIVILSLTMALYHLGIAEKVIVTAFSITFGGIVLALAIAFGWGGRDLAKDFLEKLRKKGGNQGGPDSISHI